MVCWFLMVIIWFEIYSNFLESLEASTLVIGPRSNLITGIYSIYTRIEFLVGKIYSVCHIDAHTV